MMQRRMKNKYFSVLFLIFLLGMTGCKNEQTDIREEQETVEEAPLETIEKDSDIAFESQNIAMQYQDIYEQTNKDKTLNSLEVTKRIMERIGAYGCTAVDVSNEINMVNAELLETFCKQVNQKETAGWTAAAGFRAGWIFSI